MSKSAYLADAIINHVLRGVEYVNPTEVFLGLFTTTPFGNDLGIEVSASEYERRPVTMTPPQNRVSTNEVLVTFPVALTAWGSLTGFGIFDAQTDGNLLYFGPFANLKVVEASDLMKFEIGQLVLVEN